MINESPWQSDQKDEETYTISELAQQFGVTTRTIRYYEEVGLLKPCRRVSETKQRRYYREARGRLKLILRGKRFGFSLDEIKDMIELYHVDPTEKEQLKRTLIYGEKKLAEIEEMIRDLYIVKEEMLELREKFSQKLKEIEEKDEKKVKVKEEEVEKVEKVEEEE